MGMVLLANQTAPATPSSGQTYVYPDSTAKRLRTKSDTGNICVYPYIIVNASAVGASSAFATDTYLTGSSVQIPSAGDWVVGDSYDCTFDIVKTAAGTAAFTITVRMGTAGTIADASVLSLAFSAGTAAADTGEFTVRLTFQSVGSGTSAVLVGKAMCPHHLAATGLHQTGASGFGEIFATSAGFNSTTQTFLGLSINGGASFSGTNTLVQTSLRKV